MSRMVPNRFGALIISVAIASLADGVLGNEAASVSSKDEQPFVIGVFKGQTRFVFHRDSKTVEAVFRSLAGRPIKRPASEPDFKLTIGRQGISRDINVWFVGPNVSAIEDKTLGSIVSNNSLRRVLTTLQPLPKVPLPPSKHTLQDSAAFDEPLRLKEVSQLGAQTSTISIARVIGISDNYYTRNDTVKRQYSSIMMQIREIVKSASRPHPTFIRLQWPGGYLDGGQHYSKLPLPKQGETYLVCSSPRNRVYNTQGLRFLQWAGEHAIDAYPYGIVRIENGVTKPLDPEVLESAYDDFKFDFPERVSIYGQPWQSLVAFLRWGLEPQNSLPQHRPTPGPHGGALRRIPTGPGSGA